MSRGLISKVRLFFQFASQPALGRVGQADDIGSVVAFLASEKAHWITGQRIEASGGMFL